MHWIWWVIIVFVVLFVVNKIACDNPGFRHVLCCIISLAYPIIGIVCMNRPEDTGFVLCAILGPIVLAFYKFVYGLAETMENDGSGDFLGTILASLDDEASVAAIIISIVISVVFAAIPIAVTLICAVEFESKFLSAVAMFLPFVYCLICAIRFFRDEY